MSILNNLVLNEKFIMLLDPSYYLSIKRCEHLTSPETAQNINWYWTMGILVIVICGAFYFFCTNSSGHSSDFGSSYPSTGSIDVLLRENVICRVGEGLVPNVNAPQPFPPGTFFTLMNDTPHGISQIASTFTSVVLDGFDVPTLYTAVTTVAGLTLLGYDLGFVSMQFEGPSLASSLPVIEIYKDYYASFDPSIFRDYSYQVYNGEPYTYKGGPYKYASGWYRTPEVVVQEMATWVQGMVNGIPRYKVLGYLNAYSAYIVECLKLLVTKCGCIIQNALIYVLDGLQMSMDLWREIALSAYTNFITTYITEDLGHLNAIQMTQYVMNLFNEYDYLCYWRSNLKEELKYIFVYDLAHIFEPTKERFYEVELLKHVDFQQFVLCFFQNYFRIIGGMPSFGSHRTRMLSIRNRAGESGEMTHYEGFEDNENDKFRGKYYN